MVVARNVGIVLQAIAEYYKKNGIQLSVKYFISSGASDELGDILDLFDRENSALVIEPAYPAYGCQYDGGKLKNVHLASGKENGFAGREKMPRQISFIFVRRIIRQELFFLWHFAKWVDFANENGSVILFEVCGV